MVGGETLTFEVSGSVVKVQTRVVKERVTSFILIQIQ